MDLSGPIRSQKQGLTPLTKQSQRPTNPKMMGKSRLEKVAKTAWKIWVIVGTPLKFNIAPEKMVVGRLLSYWEGNFSEAMLVAGRVSLYIFVIFLGGYKDSLLKMVYNQKVVFPQWNWNTTTTLQGTIIYHKIGKEMISKHTLAGNMFLGG